MCRFSFEPGPGCWVGSGEWGWSAGRWSFMDGMGWVKFWDMGKGEWWDVEVRA